MFIQRIDNKRGRKAQLPVFASAARLAGIALLVGLVAGCGGSSTNNALKVAQVNLSPAVISLVSGQVANLSVAAVNSSNLPVATTFTFNSSDTRFATVSPGGLVCGGVWDSTFVVCNGNDALGNPITGTATITASAQSVTSGPVSVAVHPSITSVTVDAGPTGCLSTNQTHQFKAHAFHNGLEITSQVGDFIWSSSNASVVTVDANGIATAKVGGRAGVIAAVGSTTSPLTSFSTCMPVDIVLHVLGDTGNNFTFAATMNATDTKSLQVDVIDENGVVTQIAPLPIVSNNPVVATAGGLTLTAVSPGGAGLQAACVPPICGSGINTPMYSNVFSVSVNGVSPNTTTVFAASAFSPPAGNTIPLIPIDASKNPPTAGTAIPLPGVPNSIVFTRDGTKAFIGTNAGLAGLDPVGKTAALVAPRAIGKVLAVSPDGTKVLVSNAANDPATDAPIESNSANQRLFLFDGAANTLTTFLSPGAVAATFDNDGFRAYIVTNNNTGAFFVFSPSQTFLTTNFGDTSSSTSATTLTSGPFAYVANSAGLRAIATCNNAVQANVPTNSTNIQLVEAVGNQDHIIAVEPTGIDIETVKVASPVPAAVTPLSPATCTPPVTYTNVFTDFASGAFTARQLLVASNGSHFAILPAGRNVVFDAFPTGGSVAIPLPTGATEPLSGGMTPDGSTLWVGVAGTNSVDRVDLGSGVDNFHLPMTFVKTDGSPAPPNLVAIQPK
jgi:hypothetical protein